jgi:quercetin dioxygenase-like cupin family protein
MLPVALVAACAVVGIASSAAQDQGGAGNRPGQTKSGVDSAQNQQRNDPRRGKAGVEGGAAQDLSIVAEGELRWQPAPDALPPGAEVAILAGDLAKDGLLSARYRFPANYTVPPHSHDTDEHMTVLSGTLLVGHGDKLDRASAQAVAKGGYVLLPAGSNHFIQARTDVVVQRTMRGPFTVNYVNPADDPRKKPGQPGQPGAGKNPFLEAVTTPAPSIARADLLAVRQLGDARIRNGRDLDVKAFSRALTGTWVRELTWYGIPVQNESALYFDFRGDNLTAMMFDQSNLGKGPMARRLDTLKEAKAINRVATLTFVNGEYLIVDRYYKVSEGFIFDGLEVKVKAEEARPLKAAWDQLDSSKFFDRRFGASDLAVGAGDSEVLTPSVGGAYWQVSLTPSKIGKLAAADLKLDGIYRGAHVGDAGKGGKVQFQGTEVAQFFMEGNKYVCSKRELGSSETLAGQKAGGWMTDCASFFNLPHPINWDRVVLDPGR